MRKFLLAVGLGLLGYLLSDLGLSEVQSSLIGVVVFLVVLWTNEGLPLGVVSLMPILLFPIFGINGINKVSENYSKPIIFLFLGGFMLALAVEKTGLHRVLASKILKIFPATPRGIIAGVGLCAALISSILSNTTAALLLLPLALVLTDEARLKKRLVLAIAFGASIGGIITPIGTPPNLLLLQFLKDHGLPSPGFLQWILLVAPLALLMMMIATFVLSSGLRGLPAIKPSQKSEKMSLDHKKLLLVMGAMTLILMLNTSIGAWPGLKWDENLILLGFGLSLFLPRFGLLNWDDSKGIPYEIVFLFGAGFALAAAFNTSGLANEVASLLCACKDLPFMLTLFIIATLVTTATGFTSNTALVALMLPVVNEVGIALGGDNTTLMLMVTAISASYAFILPISTPPNAIAVASGEVSTRDLLRYGSLLNLAGIIAITLFAMFFWKFFI